jgi:hypothetical protein
MKHYTEKLMKTMRIYFTVIAPLIFAICSSLAFGGAKIGGNSQIQIAWDMADIEQAGQLTIYNSNLQGGTLGLPVQCGDINGDGLDDIVECAIFATGGLNGSRVQSGQVNVNLSAGLIDGVIVLSNPTSNSFSIQGATAGDYLGTEAAIADVNGDGLKDILLGALPPGSQPPTITAAQLLSGNRPVGKALAGQSGLRLKVNASGVTSEAEVYINGNRVPSEVDSSTTSVSEREVNLDNVPAARDRVGSLFVQIRNLDPPSELSPSFIAGELVGPEIETISLKPKEKGFNLTIAGRNLHPAASVEIKTLGGQTITPKKATIESDSLARVKVRSGAPSSGTRFIVKVINPNNVASNEKGGDAP